MTIQHYRRRDENLVILTHIEIMSRSSIQPSAFKLSTLKVYFSLESKTRIQQQKPNCEPDEIPENEISYVHIHS